MTRSQFLDRLRDGLSGLSRSAREEIMADYEGHFAQGLAAGRGEAEVAAALGDPGRLARELRAGAGVQQWEEKRSPSSAVTAVFAILGLGAIDFLILLPIAGPVLVVIIAVYIVAIALCVAGAVALLSGLFSLTGAAVFAGFGLLGAAAAIGALQTLVCIGLVNALVWYARLHVSVIQPAVSKSEA